MGYTVRKGTGEEEKPMAMQLALVGNENCGKRTVFASLTGDTGHMDYMEDGETILQQGVLLSNRDIRVAALPSVSALSGYDHREKLVRRYLVENNLSAIINVVDAVNLEQNLYLTLQLLEIGVPVIVAMNRSDLLENRGQELDRELLRKELGADVVNTTANRHRGVTELAVGAVALAKRAHPRMVRYFLSEEVARDLRQIRKLACGELPYPEWTALQLFQRDEEMIQKLALPNDVWHKVEDVIQNREEQRHTDSMGIVAYDRYAIVEKLAEACLRPIGQKKRKFLWW